MGWDWDWKFGFADDVVESLFGGKEESRLEDYKTPEFQEDPDYREMQDYLKSLGVDILEGDIPEYFAGIGETGGAEFENYLNLISGDIERTGLETAAATGRGGGAVQDIIGQATGEFTTKARYADYVRSLEGKQQLLNTGLNVTTGVRGAGQTQQAQVNQFALNKAGLDIGLGKYLDGFDADQDLLSGGMFGELLSTGINAGVGYATGGPVGAVAGAMGGVDWGDILSGASKNKSTTSIDPAKQIKLGRINDYKVDPYKNLNYANILS